MFFYLSKIISFLISPTVWIALLLISALIVRNDRLRKRLLIFTVIAFLFFSNRFIVSEIARIWEISATPYSSVKNYNAAIVLGGMINLDPKLDRLQFMGSNDRMMQAVELYKRGYVKKIIFTGGSGSINFQQYKEGAMVKRFYIETLGIPSQDLIIENASKNTYENASLTKQLLNNDSLNASKYLLITSGFHMRRSMACFAKQEIICDPYSTDRLTGDDRLISFDHLLIPHPHAFEAWEILMHEWVGCITYKLMGYI